MMADSIIAEGELDGLETEARLPAACQLDQLTVTEQLTLYTAENARAVEAITSAGPSIEGVVELVADRLGRGGRLFYVGAGTSGRLASLDAAECVPTFGLDPGRIVAILAGGDDALARAVEGSEDDTAAGRADLEACGPGTTDVVVGIAASGRTPYVLAALALASERGAATVALVNSPSSPMARVADHRIEVLTGAELIAGSTRMKAGTVQKLVLNAISTLAMVRLGRTYGDLMVDVQVTNDKLRRRAERIVQQATGAEPAAAAAALDAAGGSAKAAVVMLLLEVDASAAQRRLQEAGGHVRAALRDRG